MALLFQFSYLTMATALSEQEGGREMRFQGFINTAL